MDGDKKSHEEDKQKPVDNLDGKSKKVSESELWRMAIDLEDQVPA